MTKTTRRGRGRREKRSVRIRPAGTTSISRRPTTTTRGRMRRTAAPSSVWRRSRRSTTPRTCSASTGTSRLPRSVAPCGRPGIRVFGARPS
jgi:hypothetical protein